MQSIILLYSLVCLLCSSTDDNISLAVFAKKFHEIRVGNAPYEQASPRGKLLIHNMYLSCKQTLLC